MTETPTKRPRLVKEHVGLTLADPRLDVFRPDPALVGQYVSRIMPNGQTDIEYLTRVYDRRENVLLVGDTQGGKTMVVNVMAIKLGERMGLGKPLPVFTLSASSGITDFDLFGQQVAWLDPETGVERIVDLLGLVKMASDVGGILYLDEIPMMPERVTSSLHPVTDWRRSFTVRNKPVQIPGDGFMPETVHVSPDLWVVGTMNAGYLGGGRLNEAFANRFRHLDWPYDRKVEAQLVKNEGVMLLGEALRAARAIGNLRVPVGTAALMRLATDVVEDGPEMALFTLKSMFTTPDDKAVVEEIIESQSFAAKIVSMPTGVGTGWPDPDGTSPF